MKFKKSGCEHFAQQLIDAGIYPKTAYRIWPLWITLGALLDMYEKEMIENMLSIRAEQYDRDFVKGLEA